MTKNIFKWGLISLLVLASPLIFIEVLSYLTINIEFHAIKAFQAKSTEGQLGDVPNFRNLDKLTS